MDNCKQAAGNAEPRADERFNCLEYLDDDFPYYNGKPVGLSGKQWLLLILGVLVGGRLAASEIAFRPCITRTLDLATATGQTRPRSIRARYFDRHANACFGGHDVGHQKLAGGHTGLLRHLGQAGLLRLAGGRCATDATGTRSARCRWLANPVSPTFTGIGYVP